MGCENDWLDMEVPPAVCVGVEICQLSLIVVVFVLVVVVVFCFSHSLIALPELLPSESNMDVEMELISCKTAYLENCN